MEQHPADRLAEQIRQLENHSWRMGELFSKYQGNGWPEAEGNVFATLRDETVPALRASILASLAKQQTAQNNGFVQAYQAIIEVAQSRGATQREIEAAQYAALAANAPTKQQATPEAEPVEMSPEFTDTARSALMWVLWHHQGGSSEVGQAMRFALGMDQHELLSEHQIAQAKRWAAPHPHLAHEQPLTYPQSPPSQVPAAQSDGKVRDAAQFVYDAFKRDLEQGYETRDKRFAVDVLGKSLAEFTQQEPTVAQAAGLHPNHLPDLRYVLQVLERTIPILKRDTMRGDAEAAVVGMRYIIKRTEELPSQVIDKVDAAEEAIRTRLYDDGFVRQEDWFVKHQGEEFMEKIHVDTIDAMARAAIASTGEGKKP